MSREMSSSTAAGAVLVALLSVSTDAWGFDFWPDHRSLEQQAAASPALALARCYGRFIGWRDELAIIMKATGAYTPLPDDPARFDRVEAAFAANASTERRLTLKLRPTFSEKDFPPDLRRAFRVGVSESATAFGAANYQGAKAALMGDSVTPPIPRMQKLEALADEAFASLGEPCDRLSAPNS